MGHRLDGACALDNGTSSAYVARVPGSTGRRLHCQLPRKFGVWPSTGNRTRRDNSENYQRHQAQRICFPRVVSGPSASWRRSNSPIFNPRSVDPQCAPADYGQGLSRGGASPKAAIQALARQHGSELQKAEGRPNGRKPEWRRDQGRKENQPANPQQQKKEYGDAPHPDLKENSPSTEVERLKAQVEALSAKVSATQRAQPAAAVGAMLHDSDYDEENDPQPSRQENVCRVRQPRRDEWRKGDRREMLRAFLARIGRSPIPGYFEAQEGIPESSTDISETPGYEVLDPADYQDLDSLPYDKPGETVDDHDDDPHGTLYWLGSTAPKGQSHSAVMAVPWPTVGMRKLVPMVDLGGYEHIADSGIERIAPRAVDLQIGEKRERVQELLATLSTLRRSALWYKPNPHLNRASLSVIPAQEGLWAGARLQVLITR